MPVFRYRAIEDVPPPPGLDARSPVAAGSALDHVAAMTAGMPPLFAAGVYRYGSIEAAGSDRERALLERMRRVRAARGVDQR